MATVDSMSEFPAAGDRLRTVPMRQLFGRTTHKNIPFGREVGWGAPDGFQIRLWLLSIRT